MSGYQEISWRFICNIWTTSFPRIQAEFMHCDPTPTDNSELTIDWQRSPIDK